jgi:hypothetical protein
MWNVRGIAASGMVVLLTSLPVLSAESELDAKAAKLFKIRWSSITYNKTVTVSNPDVSSARGSVRGSTGEGLQLSGQIEILDPNRVLGTSRDGIITQLVDSAGRDVNVPPAPALSGSYEAPRYSRRFTQPPQVPKWQAFIQSVLRLPSPNANFRPQLVDELQPNSMNLQLGLDLLKRPGEVRRVKGHFYALVAESIESIEVPFEPNNTWVRLTPDLEIQVQEATCTGNSYQYSVQTSGQQRSSMLSLRVGASLPSRLVVNQLLIGTDGQPTNRPMGGMMGHVGGRGSGSGSGGPVKAFRFIIAVNPSHRKIPFEFGHIPLPKP